MLPIFNRRAPRRGRQCRGNSPPRPANRRRRIFRQSPAKPAALVRECRRASPVTRSGGNRAIPGRGKSKVNRKRHSVKILSLPGEGRCFVNQRLPQAPCPASLTTHPILGRLLITRQRGKDQTTASLPTTEGNCVPAAGRGAFDLEIPSVGSKLTSGGPASTMGNDPFFRLWGFI